VTSLMMDSGILCGVAVYVEIGKPVRESDNISYRGEGSLGIYALPFTYALLCSDGLEESTTSHQLCSL